MRGRGHRGARHAGHPGGGLAGARALPTLAGVLLATAAACQSVGPGAGPRPGEASGADRPGPAAVTASAPVIGSASVTGRATGRHTVVIGTLAPPRLRDYAAMGDRAVADAGLAWPRPWSRRLVLVAYASDAELDRALGREGSPASSVAAVTVGPIDRWGERDGGGDVRVFLVPTAMAGLSVQGRQSVISHEAAHVAAREVVPRRPVGWVEEGYAAHAGFATRGVRREVVAAELLARVRAGRGPTRLPTTADFEAAARSATALDVAYCAAWLAMDLMLERYGRARTLAFYERAAGSRGPHGTEADVDAAFAQVLGTTRERFTRDWLRRLRELAGG